MERTSKSSSVLKFIVIGGLLTGLLVGGIYLVKTHLAQPPAPVVPMPEQPVVEISLPAESTEQTPIADVELPKTGLKETFGSLIALGLFVGVVISYLRSRCPQLSL